jgi:hypothetical protein
MRKLMTSLAAASCIVGIAAATAGAQTLEVTEEFSGLHCPSVSLTGSFVFGGCRIHVVSNNTTEFRKHVFGIESHITSCYFEALLRLDEDASGYFANHLLTGPGCARQPCNVGGVATPWPASGTESGASTESITTNFCIEPVGGGTDETCEIDLPVKESFQNHRYTIGALGEMSSHGVSGFRCEVVANNQWSTENVSGNYTDVEINHLN